jgi:membrane protease YdiL (CAAX protease family)
VSWLLWALASLVPVGTPLRAYAFLPGTFAPAFVALWLTARAEGGTGTRALLERMLQWDVRAQWYLFAVLYLAAIKLVAAVVERVATGSWPQLVEHMSWPLFVLGAIVSTPFQAGEEIGWRGYALPRLLARWSLARASILIGVVWAGWHLPLFFIPGTDLTGSSFPLFLASVAAVSVAIAWLYVRTGGSLLLVMLMHAAINNTPHFQLQQARGDVWGFSASVAQWVTVALLWLGLITFGRAPRYQKQLGGHHGGEGRYCFRRRLLSPPSGFSGHPHVKRRLLGIVSGIGRAEFGMLERRAIQLDHVHVMARKPPRASSRAQRAICFIFHA